MNLYYCKQDQKYYPNTSDTPDWEIEELKDSWALREFPMYGGPALSEEFFKTFHEAFIKSREII